jgi:hypothetical protein
MKKMTLVRLMAATLLFGCATGLTTDDKELVSLSPAATAELAKPFGSSPPKIVLAINSEGKVVAFKPEGTKLRKVFDRQSDRLLVGNLVGPPRTITIQVTDRSPDRVLVCESTFGGAMYCWFEDH